MNKPEQRHDVIDLVAVAPLGAATADEIDESVSAEPDEQNEERHDTERHIELRRLLAELRKPIRARELSDTPQPSKLNFFGEGSDD